MLLDCNGLGPATVEAAKRVAPDGRVIAVEPSFTMRRVLSLRRLWQSARPLIDVRNGTAEAIPVLANSVDSAWAVNAVHHFADLALAASELARGVNRIAADRGGPLRQVVPTCDTPVRTPAATDRSPLTRITSENCSQRRASQSPAQSTAPAIGGVEATVFTSSKPDIAMS